MTDAEVWLAARQFDGPILLHKLSPRTNLVDVSGRSFEMSEEMCNAIRKDRKRIGEVWRAKVGDQRRWHYGWSEVEALGLALRNGAM